MLEAIWRSAWQGSLFVGFVWLVLRNVRGLSPATRAAIWLIATLKFLIAPAAFSVPLPLLPPASYPIPMEAQRERVQRPAVSIIAVPRTSKSMPSEQRGSSLSLDPSQLLLGLWGLGLGIGIWRVGRDAFLAQKLVKSGTSLDEGPVGTQLRRLAAQMGLYQAPPLYAVAGIGAPMVVGPFRPYILTPANSERSFTQAELRMALAHELAHIKHRDLLYRLLPELVCVVFPFLPTAWILKREWIAEREAVCDAEAILATGESAKAYGGLLMKFVNCSNCPAPLAAMGATSGYRTLKARLQMIQSLSQIPSRTRRFSSGVLTTAAFLLVLPWSVIAQGGSDQDMKVKRAQTSMNFKQAALGVLMYTQDYDGIYPYQGTSAHVFEAVRPYVRKAEFATLNPAGGRMLFNVALSGVRAVSMPKVTETLMLYDENAWPDGKRVVAYADGHVKTIGDSQWSGSKKGLKEKFPKASPNKARNRGN